MGKDVGADQEAGWLRWRINEVWAALGELGGLPVNTGREIILFSIHTSLHRARRAGPRRHDQHVSDFEITVLRMDGSVQSMAQELGAISGLLSEQSPPSP